MSLRTPMKSSGPGSTSGASSTSNSGIPQPNDLVLESRKRQSKRDEAIRRKVENDLSKKRQTPKSPRKKHSRYVNSTPGSVLSLKPSDPVICKPSYTAYEAAQLMGAKRENCILVVDEYNEQLLGIFTAKDLAFRVVSRGLNASSVTIDQIMTENPLCATSDTLASEALNLMVEKGFRHLPVIDEENHSIIGVLDITKCYQEAMEKLERMYESSKKLHDALEGVNMEIGASSSKHPSHVIKYFENLKLAMNGPILENVLDENTLPCYVNVKTNVYDATVLMKENHTTAVLVKDNNDEISGIFTSKDVVLRVIAAGLDPKTCSVIRVMTSSPDVAPKDLTIQAALRKMFDGHYLNLPVVDDGEIIGIVEVLKLTYSTLNQISMMKNSTHGGSDTEENNSEGPAWNKFWTSLDNEDTDSITSDSQAGNNLIPDISQTEINQFSFNNDNLKPSDSISVTNIDNNSNIFNQNSSISTNTNLIDNKTLPFIFKFKSPLNRNHRISIKPIDGIDELKKLILSKLNANEIEKLNDGDFHISYIDDEGDVVAITNDQDLIDCVLIYKNSKNEKADLFIHHPDDEIDLKEFYESKSKKLSPNNNNANTNSNEIIPGVKNEILLPSVLFLVGASIVTLFVINKK